ncbi:MAG: glutamate synthase-related protein [Chloroflexi bacterium]|nr:glutamate synthase-related protein [Chloroflexota bacterium]
MNNAHQESGDHPAPGGPSDEVPSDHFTPHGIDVRGSLYDPRFEHDACGIGFVAQTSGARSHEVLNTALTALCNHAHRGAVAADGKSGDGAGVLTQLPYELLVRELAMQEVVAPSQGDMAVGMIFLPRYNPMHRERSRTILNETVIEHGLNLVTWRDVPVDGTALGQWAQNLRPYIEQIIVGRPSTIAPGVEFERRLYLVRKRATQRIWAESISNFYIASLSGRTIVYKGLFMAPQLPKFYTDLTDPDYRTALAVFHQRYSTNTFPTWERAQPFRMVCHNGEINTLRGNVTWMRAREADLTCSELWGADAATLAPVIAPRGSDSAMLDNALDLLVQSGRDIRHAIMMMVPKAWERTDDVTPQQRAFYHYHSCLQEPWDGPAALSFTDGTVVGSMLDRNGLRPARFVIMDDGLVIMSSEVGAVDLDERRVLRKGRLRPGEMLAVDTSAGTIETDAEIVRRFVERQPYGKWLEENLVTLEDVKRAACSVQRFQLPASSFQPPTSNLQALQAAFGYTREELLVVLRPMWKDGREPIGSMGDDTPPAVLSNVPRPLFHYFKQRFAEVTNPPIDSLREEMVMSLSQRLGRHACLLSETPEAARLLELPSPILTDEDLAAIRGAWRVESGAEVNLQSTICNLQSITLDCTWPVADGPDGLRPAVERLCAEAVAAARAGYTLLILSDRGVNAGRGPIPSLLAVSAVHHGLIVAGERMHAGLIVESGEPREVHHFAALLGFGANAIAPWLALATVAEMLAKGSRHAGGLELSAARENYVKAIEKGILKIMSKMGISTLDSYCGAQVFDALGLSDELVNSAFAGAANHHIGGATYADLAADVLAWHRVAYPEKDQPTPQPPPCEGRGASPSPGRRGGQGGEVWPKLDSYGFYKSRRGGEYHAFNPEVVRALHETVGIAEPAERSVQSAIRNPQSAITPAYRRYADLVENRPATEPRDLLRINPRDRRPAPLEEVEPVSAILRRFSTAAMSHGSLGAEAHETLTIAMNLLGGASNSGEGGEGEERYHTSRSTKIKQVASGRFGVTPAYLMSAEELQIKMAQGSKPGEGGQLPGHKVSAEIARIRHTTPGVALISPPPHHDIYSIEDLAQLIYDLKQVNPEAAISVKLVAEAGVGTIAAGVAKGQADVIQISGHNGGTGASPLSSIKNAGVSWELGLAETQQTLLINGLRSRVRVRADGGFKTGRDVVVAALLGADEFSFGTAALIAEGCKMARQCHNNTCPVGIATQRADLRAKFPGKPEMIIQFMTYVAEEAREILASLGARSLDEIIGHTELLEPIEAARSVHKLDLLPLLWIPDTGYARRNVERRNSGGLAGISTGLGERLAAEAMTEVAAKGQARLSYTIHNTDRTVGARLSGQIARRYGSFGLPPETIVVRFTGSAGQSFGAFGVRGVHLHLTGQANDYVGKGLGGGEIVIRPAAEAKFIWHHNVILGNTALYGATGGELYAGGRTGERFAVRNSGARAVVEGVGDHGCEYMTGGVVVVLGKTGRNFGAGMTGGAAYIYDRYDGMPGRTNQQLVCLRRVERPEDLAELMTLLQRHCDRTGSPRAQAILDDWPNQVKLFWRIAPVEQAAAVEAANEGVTEEEETVAAV